MKAGKITPQRAATWAKWVRDGGDPQVIAAMAAPPGTPPPASAETMLRVRQVLDEHLPMPAPRGTVAAAGRLGDLDDGDSIYEVNFGKDPARVSEHFEARRVAARESAAAQAAALSDDELYDQIFPPRERG